MTQSVAPGREALFQPLEIRSLQLANRLAMSPMTRMGCPDALPDEVNRAYYASRAAGGTGLVVTEGIGVDHPTSVDHSWIPRLDTPESVEAWRLVTDAVHAAGGSIIAQLWHVGPLWGANARFDKPNRDRLMEMRPMRPSGLWGTPGVTTYSERSVARWSPEIEPMTEAEIAETIEAYERSAKLAMEAGFDGVTLHGGHGYLLDAFVWADTNRRTDSWGGDLAARVRYPAAVVAAVREAIGPDAPLFYRFSQHTQQDYTARKAENPEELGIYLGALAEAGVDLFDASTRRFSDPAFPELGGDDGEGFTIEAAFIPRALRIGLRTDAQLLQVGPAESAALGDPVGGGELVGQIHGPVVGARHAVGAVTHGRAQGDPAHRLDAAGDADVHRASVDEVGDEMVGLLRRGALAVDGRARGLPGQAGGEPGAAGDVVALCAGLGHAAADDLLDQGGVDACPADDLLLGGAQQVRGVEARQRAACLADRGTYGLDDDGISHGFPSGNPAGGRPGRN